MAVDMAVRYWYMLALLVLAAVSWRSQGTHYFINKHEDNRRSMRRLRYFHKDQPGLIMGQQKHSLVEEIAQQVGHSAVSLLLSSLFYHTGSVQASVRQWFANSSW